MMLCQKRKAISQNEIRSNAYRYPQNAYFVSNEKLTPEEIRVEGLRKLIGVIERGKYKHDSSQKKNVSPWIRCYFYTGNLYDF